MSTLDDLTKLVELKEKGVISLEEFELQKTKLLLAPKNLQEQSPKSRTVYGLLGFFLGWCGIHNFYLGRKIQGAIQLLFCISLPLRILVMQLNKLAVSEVGFHVFYEVLEILSFFIIVPIWCGINLLATQKDGRGRQMNKSGRVLCIVLGIILIVIPTFTLICAIPSLFLMGIFATDSLHIK